MMATRSRTKLANETWEALFRAQSTIVRELAARDAWEDLVPREYGVLYALSSAPQGLRITGLCSVFPMPRMRGRIEFG